MPLTRIYARDLSREQQVQLEMDRLHALGFAEGEFDFDWAEQTRRDYGFPEDWYWEIEIEPT